jgi:hypothetical protein
MVATNIEQSKKLLELGLDSKTADLYYWCGADLRIGGYKARVDDLDIPSWSLDKLLELMPLDCGIDKEKIKGVTKYVASSVTSHEVQEWSGDTPLDAAYNLVVWLLENHNI